MIRRIVFISLLLIIFSCGGSGDIQVPPPRTGPITIILDASLDIIAKGYIATISWHVGNANECFASGGWDGQKSFDGNEIVSPEETTEYILECFNEDTAELKSVQVTVIDVGDASNTSYDRNVLVIHYYSKGDNGVIVEPNLCGFGQCNDAWIGIELSRQEQEIHFDMLADSLLSAIETGSTYLGYKDPNAEPSLRYYVVGTIKNVAAVPVTHDWFVDYNRIMEDHNICAWVDGVGVNEVLVYSASLLPDIINSESEVAGPLGNYANGRGRPMPICNSTYVMLHGAVPESWHHQLEVQLGRAVDQNKGLFNIFEGPCYGSEGVYGCAPMEDINNPKIGRCGNAHTAPNGRYNYDRHNTASNLSDCYDWNPDGLGELSSISSLDWGCTGDTDFRSKCWEDYFIWNLQNLPGRWNIKQSQKFCNGKSLRNWWDVIGDFEGVMRDNRTLCVD